MYKPALLSLAISTAAACGYVDPSTVAIEITSPSAGQLVSSLVHIAASADSSTGAIDAVQFELPNGVTITDRLAPFATTWDSTSVPNGTYVVRATAFDGFGEASATDTVVTVANTSCLDELRSAPGLPRHIPDAHPAGVASSIQMLGSGAVASLSLSLSIRHPFVHELYAELISPSGRRASIELVEHEHQEDVRILDRVLPSFGGEPAAGAWNLLVIDRAREDVGSLDDWSLAIVRTCRAGAP